MRTVNPPASCVRRFESDPYHHFVQAVEVLQKQISHAHGVGGRNNQHFIKRLNL
ncbi:MAG: hypothetical protein HOH60_09865 [Opitutae bacterium]|nr:hypothetical protein [Opitutae bacterium]